MLRSARVACMVVAIVAIAGASPALACIPVSSAHSACSSCHNASPSALQSGTAATVASQGAKPADGIAPARCESCHGSQLAFAANSSRNPHRDLECVACHDPHVNDLPFHFRRARIDASAASADFDAETRLCVSCHFSSGEFRGRGGGFIRHPVGIAAARHDNRVGTGGAELACADPSDPPTRVRLPLMSVASSAGGHREVVGCGTCHSLHASLHPLQLRWAREQEPSACMSCHMGITDETAADESHSSP